MATKKESKSKKKAKCPECEGTGIVMVGDDPKTCVPCQGTGNKK